LALELRAALLIDERTGRREGLKRGLIIVGTLAVLGMAAEKNLHQLHKALAALKKTTLHVADDLIQEMLARDAARRRVTPP
jgi:predicted nucleic acid-binding protein